MTQVTVTDFNNEEVFRLDFLNNDRLTSHMFQTIEHFLIFFLEDSETYLVPFNVNIRTTSSNVNLYVDRMLFDDYMHYSIIRRPFGYNLDHVRFRRMPH